MNNKIIKLIIFDEAHYLQRRAKYYVVTWENMAEDMFNFQIAWVL